MNVFRKGSRQITCLIAAALASGHLALAQDGGVNLQVIGHHDLGGAGWNSDVWAHKGYAYIGTWSPFPMCLDGAVKVINLKNPSKPEQVATILSPPNTQTSDVKVARIDTKYFHGDLLAVTNEDCSDGGARGVEFWDVSDPANPSRVSRYGPEMGSDDPDVLSHIGYGVHNTFFFEQGHKEYLGIVVDFAELFQLFAGVPTEEMVGDVRILDVSDPWNPTLVGDWGTLKNLGQDPFEGQGDDPFRLAHDIWVEHGIAYISYWDAGLVLLDVKDPSNPTLISQTYYADSEEGNTHVAVPARHGRLVITGDEDFGSGPWGFMRIFDTRQADNPVEIATFATPNTTLEPAPLGDFTMHNLVVHGNRVYVSWYTDGIRVIDISKPTAPREIGSYVPPAMADPNGYLESVPYVWGVHVHRGLILASEMNGGLYILRERNDHAKRDR